MKEKSSQPGQEKCRETILIVEDDPIISFALSSRLQEDGFEIIEAGTADEALQVIDSSRFVNLVVTDIEMPGSMNGAELAKVLKRRQPSLPVIVATGSTIGESVLDASDVLIGKPYDYSAVSDRIKKLLAIQK